MTIGGFQYAVPARFESVQPVAGGICYSNDLNFSFQNQAYPLTEPGMKKQMLIETTDAVISEIEKKHNCVIEKNIQPEKGGEKAEEAIVVADGGIASGASGRIISGVSGGMPSPASGASTMNLPYHCMSFVNDKEVKMASGHKITIVIGDLAQQQVYFSYRWYSSYYAVF